MAGTSVWKIELAVPSAVDAAFVAALDAFTTTLSMFPDEHTGETRITAYGADAPDEAALAEALRTAAAATGVLTPAADVVWLPDIDWVAQNRDSFAPVRAARFHIHDSYHLEPPPFGSIPIHVDAATAFGTGHHGTTRGCLEAIEGVATARGRWGAARGSLAPVLDLGCGTAVLGIAAALRLRVPVIASDIDPAAVAMARENVRLNGVARLVHVYESAGLDAAAVRRYAPFGLILANILARPLVRLAPAIAGALAPGGLVVLSGLLTWQEQQVLSAFRTRGLFLRARIRHAEWSTLVVG